MKRQDDDAHDDGDAVAQLAHASALVKQFGGPMGRDAHEALRRIGNP